MNETEFTQVVQRHFQKIIRRFLRETKGHELRETKRAHVPTDVWIIDAGTHWVAQFLGAASPATAREYVLKATNRFDPMGSVVHFFNPGRPAAPDAKTGIDIQSENWSIDGLPVVDTEETRLALVERFGFRKKFAHIAGAERSIDVGPHVKHAVVRNTFFARRVGRALLFKSIRMALIIHKEESVEGFKAWLKRMYPFGSKDFVIVGKSSADRVREFAFALAGVLDGRVVETVIDSFIQNHADMFARALGYVDAISQPKLHFQVKPRDTEKEHLKPDYLMRRRDGYYDILDLKLPIPPRGSPITRDLGSEFMFGEYVQKLIAQLNGFRRYFEEPANARWAEEKYGVRVKDPVLKGIVGNYNNFKLEEVAWCLDDEPDRIDIISYGSLVDLLVLEANNRLDS